MWQCCSRWCRSPKQVISPLPFIFPTYEYINAIIFYNRYWRMTAVCSTEVRSLLTVFVYCYVRPQASVIENGQNLYLFLFFCLDNVPAWWVTNVYINNIHIYAFGRCFHPKQLAMHSVFPGIPDLCTLVLWQ